MSLLRKIFGGSAPLSRLRRLLEEKRWAEALALGGTFKPENLSHQEVDELNALLAEAGNGLARLNLNEGEACLRAGDRARAAEHFALSAEHACDSELRQRAAGAAASLAEPNPSPSLQHSSATTSCSTQHACTSACGENEESDHRFANEEDGFDARTRLELVLSSYPAEWTSRYLGLEGAILDAFLLAHEGMGKEALDFFQAVPEEDRDDLFYFERGALRARLGLMNEGHTDLGFALDLNPDHLLAMEAIVQLEMTTGHLEKAEQRLKEMLDRGLERGFCHSMMANIWVRRGDEGRALEHGLNALASGQTDGGTLLLTAQLLEKMGRQDDAEDVLMQLSGSGCSGGINLPLAEFWLRHGKNLDKALETFKMALRHDPGDPRWLLRVAEVYLARGWKKAGEEILCDLLSRENLDKELSDRARDLLKSS